MAGELKDHKGIVTAMTFSSFGTYLVSASDKNALYVWVMDGQKIDRKIKTDVLDKIERISAVAIDSDDLNLLLGTDKGNLHLINFETGEALHALKAKGPVIRVAFSFNRKHMLAASAGSVDVYVNDQAPKFKHRVRTAVSGPAAFSVSTSRDVFATADGSKTIRVWDLTTGETIQRFQSSEGPVTAITLTMDTKRLLATTAAKRMLVYRLGGKLTLSNYSQIFRFDKNFGRYILNSVLVSILVVIGQVMIGALAAYALSQIKFPGRNMFFIVIIGTMLIPAQIVVIPLFSIVNKLGLTDTYAGLVVPFLATGFSIFLFRQFFMTIPQAVIEAAVIDGCSHFQIFKNVVLPLSGPVIASVGIFAFIMSWNNFFWPMMAINTKTQLFTIQVGLARLKDATGIGFLMAGTVISALPMLVAFFIAQEQFIESLAGSGVKG